MQYYNFTTSDNEISYDPYWYDKPNIILNTVLSIFTLALGFSLLDFKKGIVLLIILSFLIFFNIYYILKIKNRTRFIFNKTEDVFYKSTPFGNKKILRLSTISDISTKSKSNSFSYVLYFKKNTSVHKILLTANIKNKNQNNPEVRFLEMEIIPQLEMFLNINQKASLFCDSENCSSI